MARQRTAESLQLPLPRSLTAFRDETRRFLVEHVTPARVRELIDEPDGHDEHLWAVARALEWHLLLVPAAMGGAGGTLLEASVLIEELGRSLAPVPMLSHGVLGVLARRNGETPPIDARSTYAHAVRPGALRRDGRALSGALHHVVDAATSDLVLVALDDGLYAFAPHDDRVALTRDSSIDPTRRAYSLTLADVPATRVGDAPTRHARAAIATLVAAEAVGGARRCLEIAVEWATIREQFGRPIGTFQAIAHRCADMLVEVELATAAVRLAARAGDGASPDAPAAAELALRTALASYRTLADGTMQVLGATGYTWEHDVHLHQKRAKGSASLFGFTLTFD